MNPPPPTQGFRKHSPGDAYKALCILSSIGFMTALGVGLLISLIGFSEGETETVYAGIGIWALISCISLGLLISSRFVDKPPAKGSVSAPDL
jgi:hypothetical protein